MWSRVGYVDDLLVSLHHGSDVPLPIPFSHKHYVTDDGIDCRYCHTSVEMSSFAGNFTKSKSGDDFPDLQPCVLQLRDITCELYRNEKSFVRRRDHSSCGRALIEAFLLHKQRPQLGIQFGHNFENAPLNRQDRNNCRQCCEHQAVRR